MLKAFLTRVVYSTRTQRVPRFASTDSSLFPPAVRVTEDRGHFSFVRRGVSFLFSITLATNLILFLLMVVILTLMLVLISVLSLTRRHALQALCDLYVRQIKRRQGNISWPTFLLRLPTRKNVPGVRYLRSRVFAYCRSKHRQELGGIDPPPLPPTPPVLMLTASPYQAPSPVLLTNPAPSLSLRFLFSLVLPSTSERCHASDGGGQSGRSRGSESGF